MSTELRRAVVLLSDARGLPHAAHVAGRVAALNPVRNFDIVIAGAEEPELPRHFRDLGIATAPLTPSPEIARFQTRSASYLPPSVYLKLSLPAAFADRYDRMLYLDFDISVQGGDLDRLMGIDLHGAPVAAVRDLGQWAKLSKPIFEFDAHDMPGLPYLNAGVIVIDTAAWVDQGLDTRLAEVFASEPVIFTGDQALLNLALRGGFAELPPVWNWLLTRSEHVLTTLIQPHIVHFAGQQKPWTAPHEGGLVHDRMVRSAWAAHLGAHYPDDFDPATTARRASGTTGARLRMLAEAARVLWRLRPYLNRFTDDYAALPPFRE